MAPASSRRDLSKDSSLWWSEALSSLQQLQDPIGENKVGTESSVVSLNHNEESVEAMTKEQVNGISVTIKLSWNTNIIKKTPPRPYKTTVPEGTVLRTILNEAAMSDPAYSYSSGCVLSPDGLGGMVTGIDGLYEDASERMYWMLYENPKHMRLASIDEFRPKNGSIITFKYQKM